MFFATALISGRVNIFAFIHLQLVQAYPVKSASTSLFSAFAFANAPGRSFFDHAKPVAAICHAPIMLIEANVLKGRHLTSWPSLRTDIGNAGGQWTDEKVVVDRSLVTSRKPDDIPAFNEKMIEEFAHATPAARQDRSTVEV